MRVGTSPAAGEEFGNFGGLETVPTVYDGRDSEIPPTEKARVFAGAFLCGFLKETSSVKSFWGIYFTVVFQARYETSHAARSQCKVYRY